MTPSWYDVLSVAPDASTDEIRAAWRTSVDGLDPTDRLFRQRNRAAEVLLDPARRAAHDADLAADEADADADADGSAEVAPPTAMPVTLAKPTSARAADQTSDQADAADAPDPVLVRTERSGLAPAFWVTGVLALVTIVLVAATVVAAVHTGRHDDAAQGAVVAAPDATDSPAADGGTSGGVLPDQAQVDAAVGAAETAIVPVLSYDYRSLQQGKKLAESYMTPDFATKYDQYFAGIVANNAVASKTVVGVTVLDAGVVRTAPGQVDVLLYVNRPRTNKLNKKIYHDQVTARMLDTDGTWLVSCLITAPDGVCGTG